jgi:peroxiredoxin
MAHDPTILPRDLPAPVDDGACLHLQHAVVPSVSLRCTDGRVLDLRDAANGRAVLFFYPRTGIPGRPPGLGPQGEEWDSIPGARGCTPQSCGFRDLHREFLDLGVSVWGVSTNTPAHQREFKTRMHIPFELLSDADLALTRTMALPTFEFPVEDGASTHLRRMAWYVESDRRGSPRIRRVWYPVFPPDRNAEQVLAWVRHRRDLLIEPAGPADRAYVTETLQHHWLSTTIWSIDRRYEADSLPAFVARLDGHPKGLVTYSIDGDACEVVTLSSDAEDRGIGEALLDAVADEARVRQCRRVFLTTSNDNMRALRFYQKRGYHLVAVHRGMMERYRELYLKDMPRMGSWGIPLRDEIELELRLTGEDRHGD